MAFPALPPRKACTINLAGSGVRYLRINADHTVDELTAAALVTALGVQPLAAPLTAISEPGQGSLSLEGLSVSDSFSSTLYTSIAGTFSLDLGSDATGDLHYRSAAGELARLGIGSAGQVLVVTSGLPAWSSTLTLAGNATLNGSNNTLAGHTGFPTGGTTALNRDQAGFEWLWRMASGGRWFGNFAFSASGAGSYASYSTVANAELHPGSGAGGYARAVLGVDLHSSANISGGQGIDFSKRFFFSARFSSKVYSTQQTARFLLGRSYSTAPTVSGTDVLTDKGIGVEFDNSTGSQMRARIIVHNGSGGQTASSWGNVSGLDTHAGFVLENVGNGTVNLYLATGSSTYRPSTTATATVSGGPSGSASIFIGCAEAHVANTTAAPSSPFGTLYLYSAAFFTP